MDSNLLSPRWNSNLLEMNQYIVPLAQNDPRLFSNVSQAFSLVDLGKRLLDASKNGDVVEVRNLISSGAPFTTDWLGISPLHFSAMNGHLTTCEALLKAGISRDARTKVDRTPLHLAAQEGHADIVDLLVKNGADLEAKDMLRMTALHWAAERGHSPVVQVLIKYGANANLQNKFEMTPLEISESKGHFDAHEAMLSRTLLDVISSVGKMAAPNDEIANANAFILTDEETLIPAAPPADEVTVSTALITSEEQSEVTPTKYSDDLQSSQNPSAQTNESNHFLLNDCKKQHTNWITSQKLKNEPIFDLKLSNSHPVASEDCEVDENNQNMMLVETPEGRLLYVRQENYMNSSKLAIFEEDGTLIEDANLLAQVVSAIADFPTNSETTPLTEDVHYDFDPPLNCQ